jgi:ABC-type Fe3+ transport system substrate-binding protein
MIGRFQQLFVLAIQQSKKKPEDWAAFVAQILTAQGQKIVKEGKPLETPEEHLAELTTQALDFGTKQLPIMKALQVI